MEAQHCEAYDRGRLDAMFMAEWNNSRKRLNALAYQLTGRNQADAQDLLSDVSIRLLTAYRKYDGKVDNFGAWAAKALKNQWIEHIRRQSRRRDPAEMLTECQYATMGLVTPPPKSFPTARAELEEWHEFKAHVQATREPYRTALLLHCLLDRPYENLAAALGISECALRQRVCKAKEMVREKISASRHQ